MIRVFDFKMEGCAEPIQLASMSHAMAKKFVEQTKEMLADKNSILEVDKWIGRQHATILEALIRAGGITADKPEARQWLEDQFDIPTLDQMYLFILEKSGLRPAGNGAGEATAVSTLPTSKAA